MPRFRKPALAGVVVCLIGLTAGCVDYMPLSASYQGPRVMPGAVASRYDYSLPAPTATIGGPSERRGSTVRQVELEPVTDGHGGPTLQAPLELEYYDPGKPGPVPVVLLLPILHGHLHVTRYFAHYFADQGWAAIVLRRKRQAIPTALRNLEQTMERNLFEYRRVLDWMAGNPAFDPQRIGVFGISFGGIDAVMLAAVDQRIDAVVAGMAGGSLEELFVTTTYRSVARQVNLKIRKTGLTRAEIKANLGSHLKTGPLRLAPYVNARKLLMVMTRRDWVIPFDLQQALRRELGGPKAMIFPLGHRTSFFYFPLLRRTAYDFMAARFGPEADNGKDPVLPSHPVIEYQQEIH